MVITLCVRQCVEDVTTAAWLEGGFDENALHVIGWEARRDAKSLDFDNLAVYFWRFVILGFGDSGSEFVVERCVGGCCEGKQELNAERRNLGGKHFVKSRIGGECLTG